MIIHKYTPDSDQFRNKKILVTGHAGFTGSWICQWLGMLGADVYGLGLEPAYAPSIRKLTSDRFCSQEFLIDITNLEEVQKIFNKVSPELVLHLAAQPLVFTSYLDVYGTMKSNVEGTSVILDASRTTSSVKRIVCITTDKVYKNLENKRFFKESDELGGHDPYSSSKSAAELLIQGYVQAIRHTGRDLQVMVARGGNIIGGGDFSENRIIPDLVRAVLSNSKLILRNPDATRPWQHVISLCYGYLMLLAGFEKCSDQYFGAWNFGPDDLDLWSVRDVVTEFGFQWESPKIEIQSGEFKETLFLGIDPSKSRRAGWINPWNVRTSIEMTAAWYRKVMEEGINPSIVMENQIQQYMRDLKL